MKIFEGNVKKISDSSTAIIEIERKVAHPIYKKLIRKRSSIKIDTGGVEIKIGDKVKIVETRPISKHKNFKIYIPTKKEIKK